MTIQERLNADLKTAMKEKNQSALRAIRAAKTAFMMALTDGSGNEIDSKKEMEIIQKLLKQRQESLDIFTKQMREDLAAKEREEIEILQEYLPQQMDDEALADFVKNIINETGATSMKDMGSVMAKATDELAGRADTKKMAGLIKDQLSGK